MACRIHTQLSFVENNRIFYSVCKWDSLISIIKLVRERLDSVTVVGKWRVRQKPEAEHTKKKN